MEDVIAFAMNMNLIEWFVAIQAMLAGLLGVALLIPGDTPDKQLQKAVDFINGFSKK